jgi:hypothetical protein
MNSSAKWFGRIVWLGIFANMFFVIPCCFFPEFLLSLLKMQIPVPIIWVRATGLLLLEISILYIPGAIDPYRYQATAWMSVLVTRGGGSSFFLIIMEAIKTKLGKTIIAIAKAIALLIGTVGYLAWYNLLREVPTHYESVEEQFKYGSIGTENAEGIPYWIWFLNI